MTQKIGKAAFAAGCFWHIEEAFHELAGVISTSVGYMGGNAKNPVYEQVCSGKTGHAEAVLVEYDASKISYSRLLEIFWSIHDPTQLNRQGADIGSQYRSVIFYFSERQKAEAELSMKQLQENTGRKIVTQVVKASEFWKAEEYHQCHFLKHR